MHNHKHAHKNHVQDVARGAAGRAYDTAMGVAGAVARIPGKALNTSMSAAGAAVSMPGQMFTLAKEAAGQVLHRVVVVSGHAQVGPRHYVQSKETR